MIEANPFNTVGKKKLNEENRETLPNLEHIHDITLSNILDGELISLKKVYEIVRERKFLRYTISIFPSKNVLKNRYKMAFHECLLRHHVIGVVRITVFYFIVFALQSTKISIRLIFQPSY